MSEHNLSQQEILQMENPYTKKSVTRLDFSGVKVYILALALGSVLLCGCVQKNRIKEISATPKPTLTAAIMIPAPEITPIVFSTEVLSTPTPKSVKANSNIPSEPSPSPKVNELSLFIKDFDIKVAPISASVVKLDGNEVVLFLQMYEEDKGRKYLKDSFSNQRIFYREIHPNLKYILRDIMVDKYSEVEVIDEMPLKAYFEKIGKKKEYEEIMKTRTNANGDVIVKGSHLIELYKELVPKSKQLTFELWVPGGEYTNNINLLLIQQHAMIESWTISSEISSNIDKVLSKHASAC